MEVRDLQLLEATMRADFTGYARPHSRLAWQLVERVTACLMLLSTMLLSRIVLGTPARRRLGR